MLKSLLMHTGVKSNKNLITWFLQLVSKVMIFRTTLSALTCKDGNNLTHPNIQVEPEETHLLNSKQQPTETFKICKDNLTRMCNRQLMYFFRNVVKLVLKYLLLVYVPHKRFTVHRFDEIFKTTFY
jgi:hypothetical protein